VARWDRGWATSGPELRLGVPVLDWGAWFSQRGRWRAAAVVQVQHGCGGAKSGKGEGSAGQHMAVEALGRPSGVARRVGWLGVQAGDRAHRWLLCGGRGKFLSGEQAVRLGQHVGV
jgi:hypothetical protein